MNPSLQAHVWKKYLSVLFYNSTSFPLQPPILLYFQKFFSQPVCSSTRFCLNSRCCVVPRWGVWGLNLLVSMCHLRHPTFLLSWHIQVYQSLLLQCTTVELGLFPWGMETFPWDSLCPCLFSQSHPVTSDQKWTHRSSLLLNSHLRFGVKSRGQSSLCLRPTKVSVAQPKKIFFVCQEGRSLRDHGKNSPSQSYFLKFIFHISVIEGLVRM